MFQQPWKLAFVPILLLASLSFCGCDSINEAQKRNTVELPSNPDAAEQAEQSRKQAEAERARKARMEGGEQQ